MERREGSVFDSGFDQVLICSKNRQRRDRSVEQLELQEMIRVVQLFGRKGEVEATTKNFLLKRRAHDGTG